MESDDDCVMLDAPPAGFQARRVTRSQVKVPARPEPSPGAGYSFVPYQPQATSSPQPLPPTHSAVLKNSLSSPVKPHHAVNTSFTPSQKALSRGPCLPHKTSSFKNPNQHPVGRLQTVRPEPPPKPRYSVQGKLSLEIIENIAIQIDTAADLSNFILTCKDFASAVFWNKTTVWRLRFLALYDYPQIKDQNQFCDVYQIRQMVLRKFPPFKGQTNRRARYAMNILRHMVREAYHHPPWKSQPTVSQNLVFLSHWKTAPFMYEFLGAPFFAYNRGWFGMPNRLFALLQLMFSYLVLNPDTEWSKWIKPSRTKYNLESVYLIDRPLELIHRKVRRTDGDDSERVWELDTDALLQIKNFWHAHFAKIDDSVYNDRALTYSRMVRNLNERGHAIKAWEGPISQIPAFAKSWFGHYSCTHMAGGRRLDTVKEHQTCAIDWINTFGENGVHPLNLDIEITSNINRGWWPTIFSRIPILQFVIPSDVEPTDITYIRGVAPFLSPTNNPALYSRYLSLRVRGMLHPIPKQEAIPGWQRIVMVLYQPTARYLLTVLENSAQQILDPFTQQVDGGNTNPVAGAGQQQQNQPNVAPTPEELEELCEVELEERGELKSPLERTLLTKTLIRKLEDKMHPAVDLNWEDIKWGYVYEGVVVPGGKIMMGRFWRVGLPEFDGAGGMGIGMELGYGADRGPFVFWC